MINRNILIVKKNFSILTRCQDLRRVSRSSQLELGAWKYITQIVFFHYLNRSSSDNTGVQIFHMRFYFKSNRLSACVNIAVISNRQISFLALSGICGQFRLNKFYLIGKCILAAAKHAEHSALSGRQSVKLIAAVCSRLFSVASQFISILEYMKNNRNIGYYCLIFCPKSVFVRIKPHQTTDGYFLYLRYAVNDGTFYGTTPHSGSRQFC